MFEYTPITINNNTIDQNIMKIIITHIIDYLDTHVIKHIILYCR